MADSTERLTSKQKKAARKVERLARQVETSRAFSAACATPPHTNYATVADECGITASKASCWANDEQQATPTVADLHLMPKNIAHALLRSVASTHGLIVSDAPVAAGTDLAHVRRLTALTKETGEAQGAYAAHVLGTGSLPEALRELREAAELIASAINALESERKSA